MEKEERLEAFEKVLQAVKDGHAETAGKLAELKKAGRVNSATYRQLMGRKMNYTNMLSLFSLHGIE